MHLIFIKCWREMDVCYQLLGCYDAPAFLHITSYIVFRKTRIYNRNVERSEEFIFGNFGRVCELVKVSASASSS